MRMRTALAALSVGALLALPNTAQASSHREAPFITKNPKVDGTDFYVFSSYEAGRTGYVTFLANYIPLQSGYGGPNFFQLDPDALYEILIDNNGDGKEDLTFQFQFKQTLNGGTGIMLPIGAAGSTKNVAVPFFNVGDLSDPATGAGSLNVSESYSLNLVTGDRRTGTSAAIKDATSSATSFAKPPDNIGPHSFTKTAYAAYAQTFIHNITIPNCAMPGKVFVGQRAEGFAVNLGPIFDLVDAPVGAIAGGAPDAVSKYWATKGKPNGNPIGDANVTTLALELPASCITQSATQPVIGAWTTASVRQARVINPGATYTVPSAEGGAWTQVSRLSNPLVNEVVIGVPDKDHFNSSSPKDDAQFATYVTNPTLPKIIDVIFGKGLEPQVFPRADLVEAFLTGVPTVNAFPAANSPVACEMIRLNTAVPPTTDPTKQFYLGAAGCFVGGVLTLTGNPNCDPAGFPNGRRPGDDVVDIALDVMEGYLIGDVAKAPGATTLFTDAVINQATQFDVAFPYLKPPNAGANGDGT